MVSSKSSKREGASYWLVKQEPGSYSWEDFVKDKGTRWDGVRNYQARNNLKAMKKGDRALFYHSGKSPEVVGVAEVSKTAYQDPTTSDDRWVAVDLKPVAELKHHVSLASMRENKELADLSLLKQGQLSVMAITAKHFKTIMSMGS